MTVKTVLAALLLLLPASLRAQFEGIVRMAAISRSGDDSSVVMSTVSFKGRLLTAVIEPDDPAAERGGTFILRGDRNVMWIVIPEERRVMEIPLGGPGEDTATGSAAAPKKTYTLERTGKTSTLAGYACEEWVADEGRGRSAKIWATAGLGDIYRGVVKWFDEMSMASSADGGRWEREIAGKGLFPMSVDRYEDGELTGSEEVLSVEKREIPAATFEPPAGYEVQHIDMDFEKMFQEMNDGAPGDSTGVSEDRADPHETEAPEDPDDPGDQENRNGTASPDDEPGRASATLRNPGGPPPVIR